MTTKSKDFEKVDLIEMGDQMSDKDQTNKKQQCLKIE
jgi:hypothetical protein